MTEGTGDGCAHQYLCLLAERAPFFAYLEAVVPLRLESELMFFCDRRCKNHGDFRRDWINVADLLHALADHWIHYHRDLDEPI